MSEQRKRHYLRSPEAAAAGPSARPVMADPPDSPCVGVCTPDDEGLCLGCFRTLDEIARWSGMNAEEQWEVVEALPARDPLGGD
jgi:uncharacterized protein